MLCVTKGIIHPVIMTISVKNGEKMSIKGQTVASSSLLSSCYPNNIYVGSAAVTVEHKARELEGVQQSNRATSTKAPVRMVYHKTANNN